MKDYDCYLFDADGTLIDTTELICRCFEHTCASCNVLVPDRSTIIPYIGLPLRSQLELYFGPLDDAGFARVAKIHMDFQISVYRQFLNGFPSVKQTLETLVKRNKKLAVVSSRRTDTLTLYLRATGILDYFSILVTPEHTERHKPDPEPALHALGLLQGDPASSLFVGDTTYDVQCGASAGMDTAFVLWSRNSPESCIVTPTWTISSMNELLVESL